MLNHVRTSSKIIVSVAKLRTVPECSGNQQKKKNGSVASGCFTIVYRFLEDDFLRNGLEVTVGRLGVVITYHTLI